MKSILLLIILALFPIILFAQIEIDGKPLNDEQREMVKSAFSTKKFLSKVAENACVCIDSINISNKNAKETSLEVKKCIDNQVITYQTSLMVLKSADQKEGANLTLELFTNPKSAGYTKYYYQIERQIMDSCQAVKDVVGMNNKENKKSISDNSEAVREYNKGNNYLRQNDYKNALPFYVKAVKIDSEFVFAWDNIGVCNRNLGNYDAAINAYKKSIKIDPNGVTAFHNIALAYIGKKDFKKAIESYQKLAKLDDENPEVYYGTGMVYFYNLKEYEKALDNFCKAYSLYIAQNSPYRTDAETNIQKLYSEFKKNGKVAVFNKILAANNISEY